MAVRRERVILELQDNFSTGMAKAAAATAVLDKELNSLSRSSVQSSRTTRAIEKDVDRLGSSAKRSGKEIDQLSGRVRILADAFTVLLPTVAPLGTVGAAGLAGLASQIGFATVAAGTAVLAFQDIGDTLKAVNKAAIEPTAENLDAARVAMRGLTPAARDFVRELRSMQPELDRLKDVAATNLLPGVTAGLEDLQGALPAVERIIGAISAQLGSIAEDAGASLASDRWMPFFDFIATEGPPALADLAAAIGNTTHALAELWMAFAPLNAGFSDWLVESTADLDRWASSLSETQGFQEFIDYVRETGPQLAQALGSIANAFLQVIEAAAPLAGPVLESLTALANLIAVIADSDLGTPIYTAVAAMVIFNRTMQVANASALRLRGGLAGLSTGAKLGGLVLGIEAVDAALDGLFDKKLDGSNLDRSLNALASGKVTGEIKDKFGKDLDELVTQIGKVTEGGLGGFARETSRVPVLGTLVDLPNKLVGESGYGTAIDNIKQLDQALAGLVESGNGDEARAIVDEILAAGASTSQVEEAFKQYGVAVENATGESAEFTQTTNQQSAALLAQRQAVRQASREFLAFGENLDDSEVSLRNWIQSLEDQATALSNFASNSVTAADKGLNIGLINKLREEGVAGALRLQELARAAPEDIKAANAAWRAQKGAINDNVAAAEALRKKAETMAAKRYRLRFGVEDDQAKSALVALNRLLAGLKDRNINVTVTRSTNATVGEGAAVSADGGSVPKTGKPYADRHLYLLADGEEVVSNRRGQADRYRPLLKAINNAADGRTIGNPGLASYIRNDLDMKYPTTLKQWNRALAESTKVLDKEKSKRQELLDQAQSVRDSIRSGYRSDLFGGDAGSSVWMSAADRAKAGTGDVFSTLTGDITNLNALQAATKQLQAKGLDGGALAELLSSGSLADVQAFASGSKADVQRYEDLYNQREKALALTANLGATASFGPLLAASRAEIVEIRQVHKQIVELRKDVKAAGPRRPRKGNS